MRPMIAGYRTTALLCASIAMSCPIACGTRRGLEPARAGTVVSEASDAEARATAGGAPAATPASDPGAARGATTGGARDGASGGTPAMWRNDAIPGDDLGARAMEAAGALVLEEMLIERALRTELARRELTVDDAAIAREETMAREALSSDPARAEQLLQALRASQGLGAIRWTSLLWRNAALRTLARDQSSVGEPEIATAHDLRHGPRRAARIIVMPDLASVQRAMERLAAGETFSDVASALSTDTSRDRGGLVSPVSRLDPTWPATVREALWALEPGTHSAPVLIDDGYIIVRCEGEIPGDGVTPEAARAESERTARLAVDRVEMDRIQREIVRGLDPTIFDRSLDESWRRTRDSRRVP